MPPLKSVDRLEKLCSWKIANHLFGILSSWYKAEKGGKCTIDLNNASFDSENGVGPDIVDGKLETFDFMDYNSEQNDDDNAKDEWYIKHLTYNNVFEDDSDSENSRTGIFTPVPQQYRTVNAVTHWLAREVRDFMICHLAPRFHEEILATVINMIASRIEIPRPKEKLRVYEEDLDFLKTLGFLLSVCLRCLMTKGVTALDLSHVSHLLKRWRLVCSGGGTKRNGEICVSPYFDIFGYAFDVAVSGLRTLKFIKLPHFVHNSFVRKVAYLCPNLEILILRCSADCANPKHHVPVVTNVEVLYGESVVCPDGQVRIIPGCRDLVTLALPEGVETLDVTSDAIEMLTYMPKLEYLVGVPMIYVTEEFEEIFETLPVAPKLTNFHHGAYPKSNWPSFVYEESLLEPNPEYLARVFSQVKEVGIYAPTEVTEKVLKSFSKAQDITIFTDDFEVHGKYLKNLTSLDINVGYQEEWPILISLSQTSPKLEQLTLRSFSLQISDIHDQKPCFPLLRTLKFHGQNVLQGDALLTFIGGCPLLTTFVLSMITDEDGEGQLDDDILLRAAPLLPNIQKFIYKVQSALRTMDGIPSSLTMKSCDALINACPQLTHIGQMETWKVTKSEIVMLQEKLRKRNWDLEIV
ncbi:hypothetical protein OTU49_001645 [Cherax quadricarinatus]|uniref:Uncharacterized protein n=1 Tax=Cherax quadricarinatus TaxID=27406 RepID=A0AAW0XIA8_CHEQU|nr:uncharacterized protein LOC128691179 [Cherax quadricarinatus]XP_053636006.1 uncharacterized protein LOC128691179 [Cherax quadricarinatus]XP_053636007.1 uncharacterized protein LOC128691179 [Cherax quadricarinatus]XP_053636008.1 uncharacterized protein LOC128691179 [Cherax quadricarinatus]XP_053636009.1 uncharacterized protein LOC128691179 [Cherax quadricarinatus]XP_053636010.1 uncharacterized protein LOC128691179 [Cherax quadricarinatus]XP_053636011.1 uncharacterized protein LOC128691179 [